MKWTNVKDKNVSMEHFSTANVIEITIGNQSIMIDTYDYLSLVSCIKAVAIMEKES